MPSTTNDAPRPSHVQPGEDASEDASEDVAGGADGNAEHGERAEGSRRDGADGDASGRNGARALWITLGAVGGGLLLLVGGTLVFKDELTRVVAERKFENVPGMTCQIESARLDLTRRTIVLEGFHFNHEDKGVFQDFFYADTFEIRAQGPMLSGKSTKSHLIFEGVKVHLQQDADPSKDQASLSKEARDAIRSLSRWNSDVVRVHGGEIRYVDTQKPLDLVATGLEASVENLAGAKDEFRRAPMTFELSAKAEDSAKIDFSGETQLGMPKPDFDLDGQVMGFPLESIDPLILERIGVSVDDGFMALGVHVKGRGGKLEGYLAPRFQQLKFSAELEDDLRKALVAWGLPIVGKVVQDPVAPRPGNNIQVKGQYGKHTPFELEATKKQNSWLQNRVLSVGPKGKDGSQS